MLSDGSWASRKVTIILFCLIKLQGLRLHPLAKHKRLKSHAPVLGNNTRFLEDNFKNFVLFLVVYEESIKIFDAWTKAPPFLLTLQRMFSLC